MTRLPALPKDTDLAWVGKQPSRPGAIVLPYPPSNNHYRTTYCLRSVTRGPHRDIHPIRHSYTEEATSFKDTVAQATTLLTPAPKGTPVALELAFYRPRKVGDLDNLLKVLLDAIKNLAYDDDEQVVMITAKRYDDKNNPRSELMVRHLASWPEPDDAAATAQAAKGGAK